jgi:choline dehydrogenase-like flavoprotein
MKHRFRYKNFPKYSLLGDIATIASHPLNSIGYTISHVLQPVSLIKGVMMACIVEPPPDQMSRVILSSEKDALGMQRVIIDWRLGDLVKNTFDRSFAIVAEELERRGIAQVKCGPPIVSNDWPMTFEDEGTWHHMGTTRMHSSAKKGVVDVDCRVHGMHNLYVAGSSVFPTAGANFPTLTLVALALRLADRLKSEIKS